VTGRLSGLAPPVSTPITLGAGNSTTKTRTVATFAGDAGRYTVKVGSEDDNATAVLTVENQADQTFTSPIDGVSDEFWTEVTGDGTLKLGELGTAIQEYQDNGEINGVTIELSNLGSLIQYYQDQK
jgi:hypothetical protein